MQAVSITARRRVRRDFQQLADLLERVFMPDFQYNHFALLERQFRQTTHRRPLPGCFIRSAVEPAPRFQFAREPSPQAAAVIQRPVAETANGIMLRLPWRIRPPQQRLESFLDDILSLAMTETQGPAVQDQLRGLRFVKPFTPVAARFRFLDHASSQDRHCPSQICIKILSCAFGQPPPGFLAVSFQWEVGSPSPLPCSVGRGVTLSTGADGFELSVDVSVLPAVLEAVCRRDVGSTLA